MAPKTVAPTLRQRIEQELAEQDARTTELRIALKVVHEFGADDTETPTAGAEPKRILVSPRDEVPEAVRSRLADSASQGSKIADKAFELERN